MFKFGSKRDLRSDLKCTIRLLNENEVLQSVEFAVSVRCSRKWLQTLQQQQQRQERLRQQLKEDARANL